MRARRRFSSPSTTQIATFEINLSQPDTGVDVRRSISQAIQMQLS